MREKVMDALKEHFKPEFLNRIDDIIIFHPLSREQVRSIVDLQMQLVAERLDTQKITLVISDDAKEWLAKKGYDANLGARPLKRVIQHELLDKLAMQIIEGKFVEGDTVNVAVDKDVLALTK